MDDTELIFSAESDNENVTISVAGDVLTLTPIEHWNGTANITVTVNDGFLADTGSFELTINPIPDAPVLTIGNQVMAEDDTLVIELTAFDPEGDALEFTSAISADPYHVPITFDGNTLTFTPVADWNGDVDFSVTVSETVSD